MRWYEWDTIEKFDEWHDNLCLQLGYPKTSINQLTGLPDESVAKTEIYCIPLKIENKYIAHIEEQYAEGLVETFLRPNIVDP